MGTSDTETTDQHGRAAGPAGPAGNAPPAARGDQVRKFWRLPRWRGRRHERAAFERELDEAAGWPAACWPEAYERALADELAQRRAEAAARAIETEYLEVSELWPRNADSRIPPGWVAWQPPAGLGADDGQGDELDERQRPPGDA